MKSLIDEYKRVTKGTIYFNKSTLEIKKQAVLEKIQAVLNNLPKDDWNKKFRELDEYSTITEVLYELSTKNPSVLMYTWGMYFSTDMIHKDLNEEGYMYRALFLFEFVMKKSQQCNIFVRLAMDNRNNFLDSNDESDKWDMDEKALFDLALLHDIYSGWMHGDHPTFDILKRRAKQNAMRYHLPPEMLVEKGEKAIDIFMDQVYLMVSPHK